MPRTLLLFLLCACLGLVRAAAAPPTAEVDLTRAVIVTPPDLSRPERSAVRMLLEEVEKRSRVRWKRVERWPEDGTPVIALGRANRLERLSARHNPGGIPAGGKAEGYRLRVEVAASPVVWISGNDPRGVLFGVGHLLRKLSLDRDHVTVPAALDVDTAPQLPLRGHQLGYRPKTNSYDAWTVAMWEQYYRDLILFGCNAVELIPPRSDDAADSPHFLLPPLEMMVEMSRLADDYGLDVWIWYPAMDPDYERPETVQRAVKEWAEVFRRLPRVDAVFVPGGDPGHTQPKYLLPLLEAQTASLHRYHPKAQMWVSPQSFDPQWTKEFLDFLHAEPRWLTGVVYGPQVRLPLSELRAAVPKRYPIRSYPDITHSRGSQYPVPDWDWSFSLTEARETINPRPLGTARIFRAEAPFMHGFLTYSEGCNDDVNKAVWSALGWSRDADITEVLRDYSRYFIGPRYAERFAAGLLSLERNWQGPVTSNTGIDATLREFQTMERDASPAQRRDWRFQQALYRAHYDAFVRVRRVREAGAEQDALAALRNASPNGITKALEQAERSLDATRPVPAEVALRQRLSELAEALFQSVRMQLSVPKYGAIAIGRGANLDTADLPLNDRTWLTEQIASIRTLTVREQLPALQRLVQWRDPGPGGFYDDLGDLEHQPHLLGGKGIEADPGGWETPLVVLGAREWNGKAVPLSASTWVEGLYDRGIRLRYTGLDRNVRYRVQVVYGAYEKGGPVRLVADGMHEVHPFLRKPLERLDFPVPTEATADGNLELEFQPEPGRGGNGHSLQVAEVWLVRK